MVRFKKTQLKHSAVSTKSNFDEIHIFTERSIHTRHSMTSQPHTRTVELRRTEAELPPFALGHAGAHPNEIFTIDENGNRKLLTHTHGGIQFDVDSPDIGVSVGVRDVILRRGWDGGQRGGSPFLAVNVSLKVRFWNLQLILKN